MYIKSIELENVGPIELLNLDFPFSDNGEPKPIVFIGKNGAGKSVALSNIVNALFLLKGSVHSDSGVKKNKLFKYQTTSYINSDHDFNYSKIIFQQDLYCAEWNLRNTRKIIEEIAGITSVRKDWNAIDELDNSRLDTDIFFTANENKIKEIVETNSLLYFPPNRFEEPNWLNKEGLSSKPSYNSLVRLKGISNRPIMHYSPLKTNQNWLLDVLFDRYVLEKGEDNVYKGHANNIYSAILKFINMLFQNNGSPIRFGIATRQNRTVALVRDEKTWVPNLFNLSTGESVLLDIFLTIIRDYDLSKSSFSQLDEIKGIVVVDEIDMHLHSELQYSVLPKLIKLFPKVQFIITTHSPLFLLGLRNELGKENFTIINMPSGVQIDVEDFSEFESAYSYFKTSSKWEEDTKLEIQKSLQDVLFLEGNTDIKYLKKAAEFFGKVELLGKFKIIDSDGYNNMDKVWRSNESKIIDIVKQKIILLYDCDTNKPDSFKSTMYRRTIPIMNDNPIKKGIENLFSRSTLEAAIVHKPAFIDITDGYRKKERGVDKVVPETWDVNSSEKNNLCDWLCQNGQIADFENFRIIFGIIESILH